MGCTELCLLRTWVDIYLLAELTAFLPQQQHIHTLYLQYSHFHGYVRTIFQLGLYNCDIPVPDILTLLARA